ncbi:MAG: hypothetical protein PHG83_03300 [Patescibacteria group bacterium]|nr:hypothetical protein [Patescibacteria group bacterium]
MLDYLSKEVRMKMKEKKKISFSKVNREMNVLQKKCEEISKQLDAVRDEGAKLENNDSKGRDILQKTLGRIFNQLNAIRKKCKELQRGKAKNVRKFAGKLVEISWKKGDNKGRFKCVFSKILFVEKGWFYLINHKTSQVVKGHIREGMLAVEEITKIIEL